MLRIDGDGFRFSWRQASDWARLPGWARAGLREAARLVLVDGEEAAARFGLRAASAGEALRGSVVFVVDGRAVCWRRRSWRRLICGLLVDRVEEEEVDDGAV